MDALLLFHIWKWQTRTKCGWRCEIASLPSISGDLADAANLVFWSWSHPLCLSTHWSAVPPDESLSWGALWGFIVIGPHFLTYIFITSKLWMQRRGLVNTVAQQGVNWYSHQEWKIFNFFFVYELGAIKIYPWQLLYQFNIHDFLTSF